jgi:hypothetical protein
MEYVGDRIRMDLVFEGELRMDGNDESQREKWVPYAFGWCWVVLSPRSLAVCFL